MKTMYPVVFTQGEKYVLAYSPDFQINTEGVNLVDAIEMAADAISGVAVFLQDEGKTIPDPSDVEAVQRDADGAVYPVVVDFDDYRRRMDQRAVRKNVTIPAYLEYAAERAGLNFSRVLQDALKRELGLP